MAKLPAGMRKKDNGTIEYRFTVETESGNKHRVSVYGKTVKECKEKELEKRKEIEAKGYKTGKELTLGEYYQRWESQRDGTVKEAAQLSSGRYYKMVDETPIDAAGDTITGMKIGRVEVQNVKDLQTGLSKKYCSATVNKCVGLIRQLYNAAMVEKLVTWNPADGVKNVRTTETPARETTHRALTIEETKTLFEAAAGVWYFHLYKFLVNTGLRIGEAGALRPSDIYDGAIHVRRTITRTKDGYSIIGEDTKTSAGSRDVPLTDGAREALADQLRLNELLFGDPNPEKVKAFPGSTPREEKTIFRTRRGLLLQVQHVSRELRDICEKAGIEPVTAHAFRDTFATRAIESGMDPKTLQEILGHSDIGMTMNLYVHVMEETKREQMKKLDIKIS